MPPSDGFYRRFNNATSRGLYQGAGVNKSAIQLLPSPTCALARFCLRGEEAAEATGIRQQIKLTIAVEIMEINLDHILAALWLAAAITLLMWRSGGAGKPSWRPDNLAKCAVFYLPRRRLPKSRRKLLSDAWPWRPTMIWSSTISPSDLEAAMISRVVVTSPVDGVGSPDG